MAAIMEVEEYLNAKFIQFDPAPRRGGEGMPGIQVSQPSLFKTANACNCLGLPCTPRTNFLTWCIDLAGDPPEPGLLPLTGGAQNKHPGGLVTSDLATVAGGAMGVPGNSR